MMIIRKNSLVNENDDSSIRNSNAKKRLYQNRNLYEQKLIDKIRKKKNMLLDSTIKNRTKSYNIQQRYVSSILGFLEKNNSNNSLK